MADYVANYIFNGDSVKLIKAFDAGAARAKKFDSEMKSITNAIQGQWRSLTAMVAAPLTIVGLINIARQSLETMDRLDDLSQKVGVGAEMLQVLEYQAKLSGLAGEELAVALGKLNKNMLDASSGGGGAVDAFKALNLNVKDSSGKLKSTDQMLLEIADKFSRMQDGVGKTGIAMQLFGRSGKELIPMLNQGKEGIYNVRQEMERLGILIDEKIIKLGGEVNDQFDKMGMAAKGLAVDIMGSLLPILDNATKAMLEMAQSKDFQEGLSNFKNFVVGIIPDIVRLNMLVDKLGGTLSAIPRVAAQAINYTFFLGQFKALDEGTEKFVKWNKMFEERYKDNDKLLMDSAMQTEGFKRVTKDMMETLAAPPEEYNYVKITTELGQVLYYYKEINREKNKGSSILSLTTDQQKAFDDWEKRMISVRAEIKKTAIARTVLYERTPAEDAEIEFQKKLVDNETKYNLAMKEAAAIEKEKKITLDKSLLAKQLTAANEEAALIKLKATFEYRKKLDEEQLKDNLKSAQERATIILDNETFINSRLKQDWENRITEEQRAAGLQHANLTKLLILGKISQEDYWKDIEALERASGKRQLDIIDEKNRNILEAETSHRIAMLNAAEKNMDMPRDQVIAGRIYAYQKLIQSYTADLQKANDAGDKLTALNLQAKIDEINAKIIDENMLLREQTAIFSEGLIWGIKEYTYAMKTEFQYGRDLVKDTAGAMKDSFKGALDDMGDSTFDLEDSVVNMCKKIRSVFNDMLADMAINWIMTSGGLGSIITNLFGAGGASGSSTGFGDWTLGLGFHRGGMPYEPTFTRPMPPWAFLNADRAHTGIGPRERGVVITDEEGIFTPGQMKALGLMANAGGVGNLVVIMAHDTQSFFDVCKRNPDAILNVTERSAMKNGKMRKIIKSS